MGGIRSFLRSIERGDEAPLMRGGIPCAFCGKAHGEDELLPVCGSCYEGIGKAQGGDDVADNIRGTLRRDQAVPGKPGTHTGGTVGPRSGEVRASTRTRVPGKVSTTTGKDGPRSGGIHARNEARYVSEEPRTHTKGSVGPRS